MMMPGDIREQRAGPYCAEVCPDTEMVPARHCKGDHRQSGLGMERGISEVPAT